MMIILHILIIIMTYFRDPFSCLLLPEWPVYIQQKLDKLLQSLLRPGCISQSVAFDLSTKGNEEVRFLRLARRV